MCPQCANKWKMYTYEPRFFKWWLNKDHCPLHHQSTQISFLYSLHTINQHFNQSIKHHQSYSLFINLNQHFNQSPSTNQSQSIIASNQFHFLYQSTINIHPLNQIINWLAYLRNTSFLFPSTNNLNPSQWPINLSSSILFSIQAFSYHSSPFIHSSIQYHH
jgi:hypothetical protein